MMQRHQTEFSALGSVARFTIVSDVGAPEIKSMFAELHSRTEAFEQRFSRFRTDSELTRFNAQAGERALISTEFQQLLETARDLAVQTNGLFNPFVLPALQQAGYIGTWPTPATSTAATDFSERKSVNITEIEIGDGWARMPADGALDFGGIGKGYLLDQLAAWLEKRQLSGFWLSLGGDIVAAGHDVDDTNWRVGIQHAMNTDKAIGEITFSTARQAVATSGVTKRKGFHEGRPWHHIIDPRTGMPAKTDVLTATVVAPKATVADVYAKCIVIGGMKLAEDYHRRRFISEFYLQYTDDKLAHSQSFQERTRARK